MPTAPVPTKILLDESELPTQWYNILADLPVPPPPVLHPGTLAPVGPEDLAPLFPMDLIRQEVTTDRCVDISGEQAALIRSSLSITVHPGSGTGRAEIHRL